MDSPTIDEPSFIKAANELKKRSRDSRIAAWMLVMFMCLIVICLVFFLVRNTSSRSGDLYAPIYDYYGPISFDAPFFQSESGKDTPVTVQNRLLDQRTKELDQCKTKLEQCANEGNDIKAKRLDLESKKLQLELEKSQSEKLITTLSDSAIRIGSVLIILYLIQILLGLSRYHFRQADYLAACAQALMLSMGDPKNIASLVPVLSANHIDFGKSPNTPFDKIADVVRETFAKQKSNS